MMGGSRGGMFQGTRRGHIDDEVFGSVYNRRVVLRMLPYMFRYKGFAVIATLSMLVFTGTQIAVPWLVAIGIDEYILSDATFGQLTLIFAVFVGVAGLNWVSNYAQQLAMAKVGQGILFGLRRDMFAHLQKLSLSYYDKTEVGRIMSRVQGDSGQLQEFMALVVMTLGDMLSLAGIVIMLLVLNLELGLISMVTIPILIVIMAVWQPYARKAFMRVRVAISIVNGALNENITGIRVCPEHEPPGPQLGDIRWQKPRTSRREPLCKQALFRPDRRGGRADRRLDSAGDHLRRADDSEQ